jgi:hypothetical protein
MAATSMPIASLTAIEVLHAGGNAVDAAIAACAVLAVVEPQSTGLGGDCFCLYAPNGGGKVIAVNGSGRSAAAASLEAIAADGPCPPDDISPHGVTIPGAVSGWQLLLDAYGTKGFDELLLPAIRCAEDGFPVHQRVAWDWSMHETSSSAPGTSSSCPAGARLVGAIALSRRRSPARCARSPNAARKASTADPSPRIWLPRSERAAECRRMRISPTDVKAPSSSSRSHFRGAGSTSGSARRTGRVSLR